MGLSALAHGTYQADVMEVFTGMRMAAVQEQHQRHARTLYAALRDPTDNMSDKQISQELLSVLQHLPLVT